MLIFGLVYRSTPSTDLVVSRNARTFKGSRSVLADLVAVAEYFTLVKVWCAKETMLFGNFVYCFQ